MNVPFAGQNTSFTSCGSTVEPTSPAQLHARNVENRSLRTKCLQSLNPTRSDNHIYVIFTLLIAAFAAHIYLSPDIVVRGESIAFVLHSPTFRSLTWTGDHWAYYVDKN